MIDLKKLEAKFDALFEEETEESFNQWLFEKQKKDIYLSHGAGILEKLPYINKHVPTQLTTEASICLMQELELSIINSLNTQYAMAA